MEYMADFPVVKKLTSLSSVLTTEAIRSYSIGKDPQLEALIASLTNGVGDRSEEPAEQAGQPKGAKAEPEVEVEEPRQEVPLQEKEDLERVS